MKINERFDAVLILMSDAGEMFDIDRDHITKYFAEFVPVLRLTRYKNGNFGVSIAENGMQNVDASSPCELLIDQSIDDILQLLVFRGIKRPLMWLCNTLNYRQLIEALPASYLVCYISSSDLLENILREENIDPDGKSLSWIFPRINYLVAPAEAEARLCRNKGDYNGVYSVLNNADKAVESNKFRGVLDELVEKILESGIRHENIHQKLKIALFYDSINAVHVSTIREHLEAFYKYSKNHITYISANPTFWKHTPEEIGNIVDLSIFDVVVVHYSTRLSVIGVLDEGLARLIEKFRGLKVLFIQDEYESTETARKWMDRLGFNLVYTCIPSVSREIIYPSYRFPSTDFIQILTGYVPETQDIERYAKPLEKRDVSIAYRGRKLSAVYGQLGYEKYRIGIEMKRMAEKYGLPVDIETDESMRIYGNAWYEFLGSARATLGTESGSNIFDYDGALTAEVNRLERDNPGISFDEIWNRLLVMHEGKIVMNQISPKIFEAIRLRTALVLFEGNYSDVIRPDEHYIALKKDFSNIGDVIGKINDDEYIKELTNRAYNEIVSTDTYSYRTFIKKVDADIGARVPRANGSNILQGPYFIVMENGQIKQALPVLPSGMIEGPHPLGRPMSLSEIVSIMPDELRKITDVIIPANKATVSEASLLYRIMRRIWHCVPIKLRMNIRRYIA